MTDYDQRARDIAEAQKLVLNAMTDIEGIARDAIGWCETVVEAAADDAASVLSGLSDALDVAYESLPPIAPLSDPGTGEA